MPLLSLEPDKYARWWHAHVDPLLGRPRPILSKDGEVDFRQTREPGMSDYFRSDAWRNEELGFGRTFVLAGTKRGEPPVLGYYTLAMARIVADDFPERMRRDFPFTRVPVACLEKVARDDRVPKERRLGALLIGDALRRVLRVSRDIACFGVMLYAKNKGLEAYYRRYGFEALERKPNKKNTSQLMFLSLAVVRANMPPR